MILFLVSSSMHSSPSSIRVLAVRPGLLREELDVPSGCAVVLQPRPTLTSTVFDRTAFRLPILAQFSVSTGVPTSEASRGPSSLLFNSKTFLQSCFFLSFYSCIRIFNCRLVSHRWGNSCCQLSPAAAVVAVGLDDRHPTSALCGTTGGTRGTTMAPTTTSRLRGRPPSRRSRLSRRWASIESRRQTR